jgi:integrase
MAASGRGETGRRKGLKILFRALEARKRPTLNHLRAALKSTVKRGGKRVTPHDLRRTFLTFGERCGVPFVTLKRLVNHSTKGDVTLSYVHPSDDDLRHWAAAIERAILAATKDDDAPVVRLRTASK